MPTYNQKITDYKNISLFEGLSSLRFFAAFLVVLHHGETIRKKNGIVNFEWLGLFRNGGNAVTFFFVLSGFLITYLLLKEDGKTQKTNIKSFYLKRVLRIWPLYFLLVFIGTLVLPFVFSIVKINYEMPYTLGQTWYYFLFFLPGLVTFIFGHHFLEPLWSIGVEEVFYLIWAPLFKFSKNNVLILLLSVILFKTGLTFIDIFVAHNELFSYLVSIFKFEAMAIGGLGAYAVYTYGDAFLQLAIFKWPTQIILFLTFVFFLIFHSNIDNLLWNFVFKTPIISALFVDFLFLYLIISVSIVEKSVFKIRNKTLNYLGDISYGIYMYHMLVIFGIIFLLKKYLIQMPPFVSTLVFYSVLSIGTIAVSSISKYFFEDYFLNLKKKLGDQF
jgi:peptidoglycan/LPS O-acetylase OafA/YrhL